MYRFRVAGEYFDEKGEGAVVSGGSFKSLKGAINAARTVIAYMTEPGSVSLAEDLMEVAEVTDSPEYIEVALYTATSEGFEDWMMSFDVETGEPTQMSDDAAVIWKLCKKGLK
jgi:hypothetical protein